MLGQQIYNQLWLVVRNVRSVKTVVFDEVYNFNLDSKHFTDWSADNSLQNSTYLQHENETKSDVSF